MKLSDFLNSINYSKDNLYDIDSYTADKNYTPYIINRCFSYFSDTILHSNQMNMNAHIPNKMQYDYYMNSIRKRKRFSRWIKQEEIDNLNIIKEYFGYSNTKAREIIDILTPENINEIKEYLSHGGVNT